MLIIIFLSLYSVSPYVGMNINYGLLSGSDEFTPDGGQTATTDYSGNGVGIAAQFGFDWYFTEGLSLGGKYALGFQSLGTPEITDEDGTVEGPSSTAFGISTFSVMIKCSFINSVFIKSSVSYFSEDLYYILLFLVRLFLINNYYSQQGRTYEKVFNTSTHLCSIHFSFISPKGCS